LTPPYTLTSVRPAMTLDVIIRPILRVLVKPLLVAGRATEIPPRAVGPSEPLVEELVQGSMQHMGK
jgi:hypothetical protein